MADTITCFAQISSFFLALWACILRVLSLKPRSTTHSDDLEVGVPSVERRVSGHFNTALPVVSDSRSIDGFVDIGLDPESKSTEAKAVPISTHIFSSKTSVIDPEQSRHRQPTVNNDRHVPVSFPAVPTITQVHAVDNRSKHEATQFGPYSVYQDHLKPKLRRRRDSFSDLLDQFPTPPAHIPCPTPIIKEDPVLIEKTPPVPAENCFSSTISEQSTVSSSSGSNSILSTDPSISISISISISNETANTSVNEILEFEPLPCTSAIFKVLSSGIDVKDKNIARLTLIHNPEIAILPATDVCGRVQSQPLCTFPALPQTYHDVVDSPRQADLQKGDMSKDIPFKEREKVDTPDSILEDDHISRRYEAELHDEYSLVNNPEDSSHQLPDKHTSIRAPVQVVPAVPTKWVRPFVAPLHIVKKNKVQPIVVSLEPTVAPRPLSGNWEQAMDDVLQAFRDAEIEDRDFRDLFSWDDSFVSQSSVVNASGDDGGNLDTRDENDERQIEDSFYSMEYFSMVITPPDLVAQTLKVEDASISLSSEPTVAQQIMEVKDEVKNMDLPVLQLCDCEGCEEDSYSWTAVTDDDDDDNHSQEDDQWSNRLELNEQASS